MPKIYLDRDDRIICYGNAAGFVRGDDAVIDSLFRTVKMTAFLEKRQLTAEWQDGIYDRLSTGVPVEEAAAESRACLKSVRIWQFKPSADVGLKFIGYAEVCKRYGEPDQSNYTLVWDGQLDTNDLEEIYAKFNLNHPENFAGHSLPMSDVVELYDDSGSHYCDRMGFTEISFQHQRANPCQKILGFDNPNGIGITFVGT